MKLVFIGTGTIAKAHLDAFRLAGAEVVGVSSRSDSSQIFANANGIAQHFRSNVEMIKKCQPDAVCVLTEPDSYAEILTEIQPFGLPLFIEKPLGYSVKEAERLQPLLPLKTFVGFNRRFYGGVQSVAPLLRESQGYVAQLFMPERSKDFAAKNKMHRDHRHFMMATHGIDLLTYLAGKPQSLLGADSFGSVNSTVLPQFQLALYRTDRENRVFFMSDYNSSGGFRLHFFLPQKEIILAPFEETRIRTFSGTETLPQTDADKKAKPGFLKQAESFLEGIRSSKLPVNWIDFNDAMTSMQATEWIYNAV